MAESKKLELLLQICEFYWCSVKFDYSDSNGIVFDNGEQIWQAKDINEALKTWIDTLEESNDDTDDNVWDIELIEAIKKL